MFEQKSIQCSLIVKRFNPNQIKESLGEALQKQYHIERMHSQNDEIDLPANDRGKSHLEQKITLTVNNYSKDQLQSEEKLSIWLDSIVEESSIKQDMNDKKYIKEQLQKVYFQGQIGKLVENVSKGYNGCLILYNGFGLNDKTQEESKTVLYRKTLKELWSQLMNKKQSHPDNHFQILEDNSSKTSIIKSSENQSSEKSPYSLSKDLPILSLSCIQLHNEKFFYCDKNSNFISEQQARARSTSNTKNLSPQKKNHTSEAEKNSKLLPTLFRHECKDEKQLIIRLQKIQKSKEQQKSKEPSIAQNSHYIYELTIEDKDQFGNYCSRSLMLVEMAQSEKQRLMGQSFAEIHDQKGFQDEKVKKESIEVNKSLFHFRLLAKLLSQRYLEEKHDEREPCHMNYRDSKLTHVMKECLGGNYITLVLANLYPSTDSWSKIHEQNISLLKDLQILRKVVNHVRINIDEKAQKILLLTQEKQELSEKLEVTQNRLKHLQKKDLDLTQLEKINAENTTRLVQCVSNVRDLLHSNKQLRAELEKEKEARLNLQRQLEILKEKQKKKRKTTEKGESEEFSIDKLPRGIVVENPLRNSSPSVIKTKKNAHRLSRIQKFTGKIKLNTATNSSGNLKEVKQNKGLLDFQRKSMPKIYIHRQNSQVSKKVKSVHKSFAAKNDELKFNQALKKRKESIRKSEEKQSDLEFRSQNK